MFSNSHSAIHLTKNDAYQSKAKHISVKYHFIRDIIAAGEIMVNKIHILDNPTDMLTKPLPIITLKHCLNLVGAHSIRLLFGVCPTGLYLSGSIEEFGLR